MKGCTALLPLHGGSWRMEKAGMPTWDCPHSGMFSIPLPTTKKAQILFPPVGHLSPAAWFCRGWSFKRDRPGPTVPCPSRYSQPAHTGRPGHWWLRPG